MKLLAYSDYISATGFSNVLSNILQRLPDEVEKDIIAINYYGDPVYDRKRYPGNVWPAATFIDGVDVYGRKRFLQRLMAGDYDVVFLMLDPFVIATFIDELLAIKEAKPFKLIGYFPIDAYPRPSWIEVMKKFDEPVLYTKSALEDCQRLDSDFAAKVIPHGIDQRDFYYVNDRANVQNFRETFFSQGLFGKFLITNVNRNQKRKDLFRSLLVLSYLKQNSANEYFLYLHAQNDDIGGDVDLMAADLGLKNDLDFRIARSFDILGLPVKTLNMIYNASDLIISTSRGEGWGLSITEAMATRTPVVAPDHSTISELLADGRGYLTPAGNDVSLWDVGDSDNNLIRPLVDVEKMAEMIDLAIEADNTVMTELAYDYVSKLNWATIVKDQWLPVLIS